MGVIREVRMGAMECILWESGSELGRAGLSTRGFVCPSPLSFLLWPSDFLPPALPEEACAFSRDADTISVDVCTHSCLCILMLLFSTMGDGVCRFVYSCFPFLTIYANLLKVSIGATSFWGWSHLKVITPVSVSFCSNVHSIPQMSPDMAGDCHRTILTIRELIEISQTL